MHNTQERFLSRRQQAERYGVAVRTLVRWSDDADLGFPAEIAINNRFYRKLSELETWERGRVRSAAAS